MLRLRLMGVKRLTDGILLNKLGGQWLTMTDDSEAERKFGNILWVYSVNFTLKLV